MDNLVVIIPITNNSPSTYEEAAKAINSLIPEAQAEIKGEIYVSQLSMSVSFGRNSTEYWEATSSESYYDLVHGSENNNHIRIILKKLCIALGASECWYKSEMTYTDWEDTVSDEHPISITNDINKNCVEYRDILSPEFLLPDNHPFLHDDFLDIINT